MIDINHMFDGEEYIVREHKRGKNRVQKVINVSARSDLAGDDEVVVLRKSQWTEMHQELQSLKDELQDMEGMRTEFEVLKSQQAELENSFYKQKMFQQKIDHLEQLLELLQPQFEKVQEDNGVLKNENKNLRDENVALSKENAGVENIITYYDGVVKYLRERTFFDRLLNKDITQTTSEPSSLKDWRERNGQ